MSKLVIIKVKVDSNKTEEFEQTCRSNFEKVDPALKKDSNFTCAKYLHSDSMYSISMESDQIDRIKNFCKSNIFGVILGAIHVLGHIIEVKAFDSYDENIPII